MNTFSRIVVTSLILLIACLGASPAVGQDSISGDKIAALNDKQSEALKAKSQARKKLAIRRVIRESEALLKKYPSAPNRYEVLSILFRSQQALVKLDKARAVRSAFLATCEKLAAAPDVYAELRLDADLLLTQVKSARLGADSRARSDALRPLVKRYQDTKVEAKVIRIAMIMALELGNTRLVNDLRKVIAERLPGDLDLINFQREKLAGQVFGAPFIGTFDRSDGKKVQFPMDFLGTTTAVYFWSKKDDDIEDMKVLAEAWKKAKVEKKAPGRFQFVSMNMDNLPDAGEGILRGLGLDWPALRMPGGSKNPIFHTYVRRQTPTVLTLSPTGYAAMYLSGGRSNRTYERRLQSMLARVWAKPNYASQLQSILAGEFLILDPQGGFDPTRPPEFKALASGKQGSLPRSPTSVPEDKLREIQACFIDPPFRYNTPHEEIVANYEKADALCRAVIAAHPTAEDLWVVRNRHIVALMGLWKARGDRNAFEAAVVEARAALKSSYPPGTDVVARLCLARNTLRTVDKDSTSIIDGFIEKAGGKKASGPQLVAASLLALDTGDRKLHERIRRTYLDNHSDDPTMWTATAFLLDRYYRYWMYHPPFVAGWTYGRRQGHFLSIGTHEDAERTLSAEFKTLDGESVKIPESTRGKWTVISFISNAKGNGYLNRYSVPVVGRPFDDVHLFEAVLDDDAEAARNLLKELRKPNPFPTLLVPDGLNNSIVRKLGILIEDKRPNIVILRSDGSIAAMLSGLTMSAQKGYVIQNVIELHDEKVIDKALASGDLDEAKRLAFAFAPLEAPTEDSKKKKKPKKISVPHLRSRAKVYQAMGDLKAAFADIEKAYLEVNSQAGYISMRTEELEETEALKATILNALQQAGSDR